ncbi:hypothetical protein EV192_102338 [Actinocrispum wychmicini]|uniref:Uncharacterized protein n=1 Tax=Actinocrispum wychmicini TaxID=1213861 RepID=A0A4R2JPT2_9PSEU|nr:hypothetical protein EV192_102338 [Actinocrispum wychmicini]
MRHIPKPTPAAQRPRPAGDTARDRNWPTTFGTLILGAIIGAIVGITSRTPLPRKETR